MTDERDRDQEGERPSWREIDARRDRPGRQEPKKTRPPAQQAERQRQLALRQAEALFQGKRASPAYQKALQTLEAAHGTKKFAGVARQFLAEFGLPTAWGTLNLLLDYPEGPVVQQVLAALRAQAGERSRVEQQGFRGRVKVLGLTSKDEGVRRLAEKILTEI
jgi:hypothetical protein